MKNLSHLLREQEDGNYAFKNGVVISRKDKYDLDLLRLVPEDDTKFINMWLDNVFGEQVLLGSSVTGTSRVKGETTERLDPDLLQFIKCKYVH
jgi:hypothetical protein